MRPFKLFFTGVACLCLLIQTASAEVSKVQIQEMNVNNSSLEQMVTNLKSIFTTDEDHRQIRKEYESIEKRARKWLWRYEAAGDSVAFRLNGKVQFRLQTDPENPDVVIVNGQRMELQKGKSFLAFGQELESIMNKTAFKLDHLLFKRADAFLGALALVLSGGVAGYVIGKHQCHNSASCPHRDCRKKGEQGPEPRQHQTRGRRCQMQTVFPFSRKQMNISAGRWRGSSCRIDPRYGYNSRGCFHNIASCVYWKSAERGNHPRARQHAFGKGLNNQKAGEICAALERYVTCRNGGSYQPQPQPQPQSYTPAYPPAPSGDPGFGQIYGETCPKDDCNKIWDQWKENGNQACRQKYEQVCRTPGGSQYDSER